MKNSYTKKPVCLFGDPVHHLKRDRNVIYNGVASVFYQNELVKLRWEHIRNLRKGDVALLRDGLLAEQPLLHDGNVSLNSWSKMSIPGALAVYDEKVIGALENRAKHAGDSSKKKEFLALAHHLRIGRARFDVMRSKNTSFLKYKGTVTQMIFDYNRDAVRILNEVQEYYQLQIDRGGSTGKSFIWHEISSSLCAALCFIAEKAATRKKDKFVLLSRFSTDPLESLFSFVRQSNGGSSNPDILVVTAIERHICKSDTSYIAKCLRGNVDENRAMSLLREIVDSSYNVSNVQDESKGFQHRKHISIQKRALEEDTVVQEIYQTAGIQAKKLKSIFRCSQGK